MQEYTVEEGGTHKKSERIGKGKWKRTEVSCDKEIEKKKFFLNDNQEIVPFF